MAVFMLLLLAKLESIRVPCKLAGSDALLSSVLQYSWTLPLQETKQYPVNVSFNQLISCIISYVPDKSI